MYIYLLFQVWLYYKFPIFWAFVLYVIVYVDYYQSVCMKLKEFVDGVHGVCEWMEGHNVNNYIHVTVSFFVKPS